MPEQAAETLDFFYIKSGSFRVIHVDGLIGGITPQGHLHIAMYSERPAIPLATRLTYDPEGKMVDRETLEGKEGIVRELDIDAIMTREVAAQLRDWLSNRLQQFEAIEAGPEAQPEAESV